VTFFWAKVLILFRTTSMPLSCVSTKLRDTFRNMLTGHPKHLALIHPLYTHHRGVGGLDSECLLFCRSQVNPGLRHSVSNRKTVWNSSHRYNKMWAVSVASNHFEAFDCVGVANDIVKNIGSVFLDPTRKDEHCTQIINYNTAPR
jgi:hypothetical protein